MSLTYPEPRPSSTLRAWMSRLITIVSMAKRSEINTCLRQSKCSHTKGLRQPRPDKNTLWRNTALRKD
eukprot:124040-Heterocapsa_arctica.AAC.1